MPFHHTANDHTSGGTGTQESDEQIAWQPVYSISNQVQPRAGTVTGTVTLYWRSSVYCLGLPSCSQMVAVSVRPV